jgi:hypothetical protein
MRSFPIAVALVTATATPALAHINLTYPEPRPGDIKTGPCGESGSRRGSTVTELEPGATIMVTWDETIGHEGHYRVAFDDDGQDFQQPTTIQAVDNRTILADGIDDPGGQQTGWSARVTLPDVECDNCTLQLIQVMSTAPSNWPESSLYFQCADITLRTGAGPGTPPPDPGDDGGGDDGVGGDDTVGDDDNTDDEPTGGAATGGCSAGGIPGILLALAAVPITRRSRRRR